MSKCCRVVFGGGFSNGKVTGGWGYTLQWVLGWGCKWGVGCWVLKVVCAKVLNTFTARTNLIVVAVSVVESFCVAAVVVWLFGKVENVR